LVLAGCGGSDDPVAPAPVVPPLVAGTIGVDGGDLISPDLILSIPPGALATNTELSIFTDSEGPTFGPDPKSVYRVEGLPEVLDQPVTVRLRYGRDKAGSPMLFRGEERESYEGGRALNWSHVDCRDSLGWVIADLDRGAYVLDGEKAEASLKLAPEFGVEISPTSGGHFKIFYHPERTTAGEVALIAAHFEQAWNAVKELGFNFGGADIWPRPVYLGDIPAYGILAQYTVAPHGKGFFVLEPEALVNSIVMGLMIGHEVLHSAQDHFDTRPPTKWKTLNIKRLWLDEATASWFEAKFYADDDSYPLSLTDDRYQAPLNMFAGQRGTTWAHMGYGLSQLIKYVVDQQGEGRILEFYEKFVEVGDCTPAFLETVDPAMDTWVIDFFHEWVSGGIYPYLEPGQVIPLQGAPFALVAGETNEKKEVWKLWEMGARLSYFTITDDREDPAPMLKITPVPGSPFQVSLYGLNAGQHPVLLGTAADSLIVEDLPELCNTYASFMTLGVRIDDFVSGSAEPEYRDPVIAFKDDDLARFETARLYTVCNAQFAMGRDPYFGVVIESDAGRVRGDTYHADWDSVDTHGWRQSGYLTLVFDLETMNVLSWAGESTTYFPENLTTSRVIVSGSSVALVYSRFDEFRYGGRGTGTCSTINNFEVTRHVDEELEDWLMSYVCDENSYVAIYLKDEK